MKISDLKNPNIVFNPLGDKQQQTNNLYNVASKNPQTKSFMDSFGDGIRDVLIGSMKGAGSTIFGIAKLGEKLVSPIEKAVGITGFTRLREKPKFLEAEGTAEKIGFGIEQIAEFLIPSGAVLKGSKAITEAGKVAKLGSLAQSALKVGGRAVLEGITSGGVRAAQTGSFESGAKFGAVTGGLSAGIGTTAEFLRKSGLPEKLYSQVFKNSIDDISKAQKTGGLIDLQSKFPEEFNKLVDAGIIKKGIGGKVIFNPTLAREAMDRGLKGSLKNMTNEVIRQNLNYELQAQRLAKGFIKKLTIPSKDKYINLLKQINAQYKGTFNEGRGEIANKFINLLDKSKGKISAEDTLKLRRYLDSMRKASSYRTNPSLSIAQDDFRKATDILRGVLSKITGMSKLMNEYRFTFDALESLGKEAQKRGNQALINLIDTALFGFGGVISQDIAGAAAFPLTRRALTLPSVVTGLGSALEKGTSGIIARGVKGAISQIIPSPQEEE